MLTERGSRERIEVWLEDRVSDNAFVSAARKHLVDAGLPEERVKAFSPTQVVWLDDKREYQAGLRQMEYAYATQMA